MAAAVAPPRTWSDYIHWTYIGVDPKYPGNGGLDCFLFNGPVQRLAETIIFTMVGVVEIWYTFRYVTIKRHIPNYQNDWLLGRVLLALLCLVFGMEIGFKLSTGTLIYLLNPCHVVTVLQIYLLTAPANHRTQALFRFHMHILNGATLAILFPVTNTRHLPGEEVLYFVQHILILVIPYFLMKRGGVYVVEPIRDLSWAVFSIGILFVYHFIVLHGVSSMTYVNLNNILCPAISDPFYGQWYRVWASGHQSLLMMIHAKLYMKLCVWLLPDDHENKRRLSWSEEPCTDEVPLYATRCTAANGALHKANGHTKSM